MKRFFYILTVMLLCGALSCPSIEARGRNNGNNGGGTPSTQNNTGSRSGSGNVSARQKSGSTVNPSSRPSTGTKQPSARPANSRPTGSQSVTRPSSVGNSNSNTGRPGNSGNVNNPTTRPGNNGHGNNPNVGTGNGNSHGNNQGTPGVGNRPNTGRPNNNGNNGNNRPNNGAGNNPGGPGHNPGTNPGNGGHGPGGNHGPGNNFGPGGNHGPDHGHGPGPNWGHVPNQAPYRPMLPPPRPFWRPTPPPAFRPGPRYPVINTILGVTLGTAINLSLDYLFNQGYYITGYTNEAVYLNDVMQLNLIWPNATLYYEHGRLRGSDFVYSTPYYDMDRYYNAYNRLLSAYGAPVSTNYLAGGGMECNWFGYNGEYVTLRYTGAVAANGTNRFYTTLSFGR